MKRVALINDLSGFGRCSLTAAIPVISVMGLEACPLPTAILTAQTGFPSYYCDDYTDRMDYFTDEWAKMEVSFDGIYSGYLASPQQMKQVKYFLDHFQKDNTLYLVDPIMGDHGQKYPFFNEELLTGMRELTARATVITPNLTELCLLAGVSYEDLYAHRYEDDYLLRIQDVALDLLEKNCSVQFPSKSSGDSPYSYRDYSASQTRQTLYRTQTIIVTGILQEDDEGTFVTNLAVSNEECACTSTPYTGISFSGTGDLFASTICGYLVNNTPLQEAMDKACDFLQPAIEEATDANIPRNFGIPFQKYLSRLL